MTNEEHRPHLINHTYILETSTLAIMTFCGKKSLSSSESATLPSDIPTTRRRCPGCETIENELASPDLYDNLDAMTLLTERLEHNGMPRTARYYRKKTAQLLETARAV